MSYISASKTQSRFARSRRGQFFSYDIITAVLIFSLAVALILFYWTSAQSSGMNERRIMSAQALALADALLTPGNPTNWNDTPGCVFGQIGLTYNWSDNTISDGKLNAFYTCTLPAQYSATKSIMHLNYDFYVEVVNATSSTRIGDLCGATPADVRNMVQIERIVIFKNTTDVLPAKLRVVLWTSRS